MLVVLISRNGRIQRCLRMWKLPQDLENAVIWSEKKDVHEDEAQTASRVRGAEKAVLYFG